MILADLTIGGTAAEGAASTSTRTASPTRSTAPPARCSSAEPFVPVNWATSDRSHDRPARCSIPTKLTGASQGQREGHLPEPRGRQEPSRRPRSRRAPGSSTSSTNNLCMDFEAARGRRTSAGTPYIGANAPYQAGPGGNMGAFIAWDAAHGHEGLGDQGDVSGVERRARHGGRRGVLRHARRLVQGGRCARPARCSGSSRSARASSAARSPTRGPDGKQYVAVYAGIGGDWALLSGDMRSDDPADVRDPADFMRDLARYTSQGGMVWVFALP